MAAYHRLAAAAVNVLARVSSMKAQKAKSALARQRSISAAINQHIFRARRVSSYHIIVYAVCCVKISARIKRHRVWRSIWRMCARIKRHIITRSIAMRARKSNKRIARAWATSRVSLRRGHHLDSALSAAGRIIKQRARGLGNVCISA